MIPKRISTRVTVCMMIAALAAAGCWFGITISNPAEIHAYSGTNLVRLHVIANSNSPDDQDLKLKVRDAILAETKGLFQEAGSQVEALRLIVDHWHTIERAALAAITHAGYDYGIRLELGSFPFPGREYGTIHLPAGEYEALRVIIGAGKGDNWWCVLFPPLCYVETSAANPGSDGVITPAPHLEEGEIQIRSRLWERLRRSKAVERFEAWLAANFPSTRQLAVPLIKSK